MILTGLTGNVVSLVVFKRNRSKTGDVLLLQALAAADSLVLIAAVPMSLSLNICKFKADFACVEYIKHYIIPYFYPFDCMTRWLFG